MVKQIIDIFFIAKQIFLLTLYDLLNETENY